MHGRDSRGQLRPYTLPDGSTYSDPSKATKDADSALDDFSDDELQILNAGAAPAAPALNPDLLKYLQN
jgi:hypothetical protein